MMGDFTDHTDKGVRTERLEVSPFEQISKRRFPALVHKKLRGEPEAIKLNALLKGVRCFGDDFASPTRSGHRVEFPVLQGNLRTSRPGRKMQHSVFGGCKENKHVIIKDVEANEKYATLCNEEKQCGVQDLLVSRSFQATKPFGGKQTHEKTKNQHSVEESEYIRGVKKDGLIYRPWTPRKRAGKYCKFDYFSADDCDSHIEFVARSKCSVQPNEAMSRKAQQRTSTKLESICKIHGTMSQGGTLCQTTTRLNRPGQRDQKKARKLKSGQHKSICSAHPFGAALARTACHKQIASLMHCKSDEAELNDSAFNVEDRNQEMMRRSHETPSLSTVTEKRETFQLPKVETYEISPWSILDNHACSVINAENRQKKLPRHSSGEWTSKKEAGILWSSVFKRVNEQHRITLRQPSPVAGVKIGVNYHDDDILVNTALQAVERCNIPSVREESSPPVKKFVIRLPPVC